MKIFLQIFKHRLKKCYNFVKNAFGIIFIEQNRRLADFTSTN